MIIYVVQQFDWDHVPTFQAVRRTLVAAKLCAIQQAGIWLAFSPALPADIYPVGTLVGLNPKMEMCNEYWITPMELPD